MTGAVTRAAEIVDDDLGAAPREFKGIGAAEAATSAGYDCNAAVKFDRHDGLPEKAEG
jgi:hypothetical protein